MRSLLFAPAHRAALVNRALSGATGADRIIIDLEDGVPPDARPDAVSTMAGLTRPVGDAPPAICRVRAWNHGGADDLELVGSRFQGVMLSKAESAKDVERVAQWGRQQTTPKDLWILIETARGLLRLDDMLSAAPVAGVMFGAGDLQADLRIGTDRRQLEAARSRIVFSCVAAQVRHIVDTPEPQSEPDPAFFESARSARGLGFTAKAAIHPAQLGAIHELFAPTTDEIARANDVLAMPDGAVRDGAVMVDEATKRWARGVLASVSTIEESNDGA